MISLILCENGDVREFDLDPTRVDIMRTILDTPTIETIDLPEIGVSIVFDGLPSADARRFNLAGTMLLVGASRRGSVVHPLRGDLLLVGITVDGDLADVSDRLLALFPRDEPEPKS